MTSPIQLADGFEAPWQQLSSSDGGNIGAQLHFSPANGMPAKSYLEFLRYFDQHFEITAFDNRGTWANGTTPNKGFSWKDHANDYIHALEQRANGPVVALGHSIGGTVSCIAAAIRPDLFAKVVLIDPATTVSAHQAFITQNLPQRLSFRFFEFIKRTHNRQEYWASSEEFYNNYRQHPTYKHFTEESFENYVKHGLAEQPDGQFKLVFDPHWEAYNFRKVHYLWSSLPMLTMPTLVLRAEHTYMYSQTVFDQRCRKLPSNIDTKVIADGKHLAPLEQPKPLAMQIIDWLTVD